MSTMPLSTGIEFGADHPSSGPHTTVVGAASPSGTNQSKIGPPDVDVGAGSPPPAPPKGSPFPKGEAAGRGEDFADAQGLLILAAQTLSDLETVRIAAANRLYALRNVYGLEGTAQDAQAAGLVEGIHKLEEQARLVLQRTVRTHPLASWIKRNAGVGEKQGARLLAAIGDPYMRPQITRSDGTVELARPRRVSELWSYCGYSVVPVGQRTSDAHPSVAGGDSPLGGGDSGHAHCDPQCSTAGIAPTRAHGQRANWSPEARMRARLVAESCMKQTSSPYRAVYDAGRDRYADAVHRVECRRCGPKGKPAPVGSPLSLGHQNARALRLAAKQILADLWAEARVWHEGESA